MEGGKDGGREGGREGGRKEGREEGREGARWQQREMQDAVEKVWLIQDGQDLILALAFRKRSLTTFKMFHLRSETGGSKLGRNAARTRGEERGRNRLGEAQAKHQQR